MGRKLLVMFVPVGTPGMIIHDDWNAMGLRGTATNSVTIENAFVPDRYAMVRDLDQAQATFTDDEGEVQHMAFGLLNLSGGGMQVGHCRRILDYMAGYLRKRKGGIAVAIKGQEALTRADVGWAQSTYGRMSFWVRSASTVLYDTAAKLSGSPLPPGEAGLDQPDGLISRPADDRGSGPGVLPGWPVRTGSWRPARMRGCTGTCWRRPPSSSRRRRWRNISARPSWVWTSIPCRAADHQHWPGLESHHSFPS